MKKQPARREVAKRSKPRERPIDNSPVQAFAGFEGVFARWSRERMSSAFCFALAISIGKKLQRAGTR